MSILRKLQLHKHLVAFASHKDAQLFVYLSQTPFFYSFQFNYSFHELISCKINHSLVILSILTTSWLVRARYGALKAQLGWASPYHRIRFLLPQLASVSRKIILLYSSFMWDEIGSPLNVLLHSGG